MEDVLTEVEDDEEEFDEEYTEAEIKLMEKLEMDDDDFDTLTSALRPLIKEWGTEAIEDVVKHLVETINDWYD